MTVTTRLVAWNPQVVYGPVLTAHREALAMTVASTKAITPRKTGRLAGSVKGLPTGPQSGTVGTALFYGLFVAGGTKSHDIMARSGSLTPTGRARRGGKKALFGPNFGPVRSVSHPGIKATHFVRLGAETYRANYIVAGRIAFLRQL
jgi:hypothetical protein